MDHLSNIFHIWRVLYEKDQDVKSVIEELFHQDYIQSINGVILNRSEYINHIREQRKNIEVIEFECKNYMIHSDKLFIIYYVKGKNIQGGEIVAEIIAYFEFKDKKLFKIHGQVHLSKGNSSDVDMREGSL